MFNSIQDSIYPLTVVADRYMGTYSGGKFTAWRLHPSEIPSEIYWDDISCCDFWRENKASKCLC